MTITSSIIADSLHPTTGSRLTTFVVRYPRMIHAEIMTHRILSRNASSSRAIPVAKFIAWVREDPAMPFAWLKNQSGMQGGEPLSPDEQAQAESEWLGARDAVIPFVERLVALGVHKQIANRLLEPWHHISVIVTASNWSNFFGLRYHKDAQPEFRELARKMLRQYTKNEPRKLKMHEWHLPFILDEERSTMTEQALLQCSVARAARVSFNNHDGTTPDLIKDIALHDRMVVQDPLHASPAEHQAQAVAEAFNNKLSGNLSREWVQYRKTFSNEFITKMPTLLPADDHE